MSGAVGWRLTVVGYAVERDAEVRAVRGEHLRVGVQGFFSALAASRGGDQSAARQGDHAGVREDGAERRAREMGRGGVPLEPVRDREVREFAGTLLDAVLRAAVAVDIEVA